MISATYFGEITELGSRAIWYSDEEDDDDDITDEGSPTKLKPAVGITSHETVRSRLCSNFKRLKPNPLNVTLTSCIISLSSSPHYKNFKITDPNATLVGTFGSHGKVIVCPTNESQFGQAQESSLWLMFDRSSPIIDGQEVAYFVEILREQLYNELSVDPLSPIVILSQQFSESEHLEYLSNYTSPIAMVPFMGKPILPPTLIKNHFESALFEQFTLSLKPSYLVCLPDPKNFWFDRSKSWPTVANLIIEYKLSDDNLEKTLIFT